MLKKIAQVTRLYSLLIIFNKVIFLFFSLNFKKFTKIRCYYDFLAIKSALQQENLNPEIEEKLLTLQRYQEKQMNTPSNHPDYGLSNDSLDFEDSQTSRRRRSPVSRKRPTTTHADDDDWVLDTPKKRASRAQNFPIEKRTNVVATSTLKDTPVKQQQESISVKNTQQVQKMQPLQEKVVEVPVKKVQNKQQVRGFS